MGKTFNINKKDTNHILKYVTIEPPYGSPSPSICMYPTDPVSIDEIEFHLDLGQKSFIQILTASSYHDTTPLFHAIRHRKCRLHAKVLNADRSSSSDCHFILTEAKEPMSAICNAVGKYVLLTTTNCDLKTNNISNLCVDELTIFGNPFIDVNCGRCLKNDTNVTIESTKAHARSVLKDHLSEDVIGELSSGWNCGNGIWCEECEAGFYLPDCNKPCVRGHYGQNCVEKCRELDVPHKYHCKGDKTDLCDPRTGEITGCSEGCQTWYVASDGLCQFHIGNVSWNNYELEAERVGSDWVSMTFNTPKSISKQIESFYRYYIEYREHDTVEWTVHPSKGLIHNDRKCLQSVTASDLKKDRKYDFRIRLSREHQGQKLLAALEDKSYITVTTNCIKPPSVKCKSNSCQLTWDLNQTTSDCQPLTVAKLFYQKPGDEEWVTKEVAVDQREFYISNLQYGTFRAKLIGTIGESQNIHVESDIVEHEITSIFSDVSSWKFNYMSIVAFLGMSLITLITGILCYCCGKNRNNGGKNIMKTQSYPNNYHEVRTCLPENHAYTTAPRSASGNVPAVGTDTKTYSKPTTFIGMVNLNGDDSSPSDYLNPAPTSNNDSDLYCHLNIQDTV